MNETILPYSGLRVAPRVHLADALPLAMPFALHIETTNRCNFRCVMCPLSFDDWEETVGGVFTMSIADHQKILEDLRVLGNGTRLKSLKLYSEGEPLLDPALPEKVRLSREVADRVEVTSNGSALTEQKARSLIEAGLDYLRISIYSMHPERHREVTGSKVTPAQVLANVTRFRRIREEMGKTYPFLYVKMIDTCTEENEEFLREYGAIADEAVIEKPMNWNSYENRDLMKRMYEGVDPAKVATSTAAPRSVCAYPFYSLVIKANGDVVACCVDWNKNTRVGNVHESSFGDVWRGEALREFWRMQLEGRRHENPSCRNCTYFYSLPDDLDHLDPTRIAAALGVPPAAAPTP